MIDGLTLRIELAAPSLIPVRIQITGWNYWNPGLIAVVVLLAEGGHGAVCSSYTGPDGQPDRGTDGRN